MSPRALCAWCPPEPPVPAGPHPGAARHGGAAVPSVSRTSRLLRGGSECWDPAALVPTSSSPGLRLAFFQP